MEDSLTYPRPEEVDRPKNSLKVSFEYDLADNMQVVLHTAYALTPFLAAKIPAQMEEKEHKDLLAMQEIAVRGLEGLNILYEQLYRTRRLNWFRDVCSNELASLFRDVQCIF